MSANYLISLFSLHAIYWETFDKSTICDTVSCMWSLRWSRFGTK